MKLTEADIAQALVGHLERTGHKVYQEVLWNNKVADIVAVSGPVRWVIETKTSLNIDVIEQAHHWLTYAHRVSVCVPSSRQGQRAFSESVLAKLGIGMLTVNRTSLDVVYERIAPDFRRRVSDMRLLEQQASKAYANAGSAQGGHWTPFRETCDTLRAAVHRAPGQVISAYLKNMKHHYSSNASARSSLLRWISEGKVDGLRVIDGKLYGRS